MEVKVPEMGESLTEATVADWHFSLGDSFQSGDILVELETDKVTLEVPAPTDGVLKEIKCEAGANVKVGDLLALIEEGAGSTNGKNSGKKNSKAELGKANPPQKTSASISASKNTSLAPGAARIAREHGINTEEIEGSGKRGQVTKSDIVHFMQGSPPSSVSARQSSFSPSSQEEGEKVVPMSRLRQRIAERLVEAQQSAAILTTFNEIDMHNAMEIRKRYKEKFQAEYGVNLGFMSIFVKAAIHALRLVPSVNAEIRENNIVYKNYYDISVAVGGPKGLVVPVIRGAGHLSFAEIEMEIARLANKVKEGSIELSDMEGGSFTISNGGIYGSMLSTPILNPPQSGILGMHNIVKRPIVIGEEIRVRPIMFVALSYDHRIIDGKEAVTFLVKLKEAVEAPERMLLGI